MSKKMLLLVSSVMLIITLTILGLTVLKSEDAYIFSKAFADGETKIIVEDAPIEKGNYLAISDDKILIPVSILKEYIYKDVELSEQYNRLYVKMQEPKFTLETEELDKRIEKGINLNVLTEKIDNINYINIRGLEKLFGITLNHLKERNLLIIDKIKEATEIGTIKENTYLRSGQSSFSPKLEELKKNDEVIVFAKEGKWLKVRTSKGQLGYVSEDKTDVVIKKINEATSEEKKPETPDRIGKIKSWTYLRGEKSSTGTRITRLEKGSILTILEEDEKWIKVRTNEGQEGYVLTTKLEITIQEISILQEPNITAKIKADTYLRSKKSSSSSSVVRVKDGEILDVLENDGKWVKAKTSKGKEGYILLSKVEITKKEGNEAQEFTKVGKIKSWTYLRAKESSGSTRITRLEEGNELIILEEDDRWLKVTTDKGQEGYVLASKVIITLQPNSGDKQGNSISQKLNTVREDWKVNGKINMVWDHIGKYSPDLSKEEKIEGLDVISSTWFTITNASGTVVNNGDFKYSQDAHSKGYKVWGLITNNFDKDLTKKLFTDETAQENVINQILVYSSIYNLDGINIDFENVYYEDKDNLTRFVEKLTKALKMQNLVVSIDVTVPSASETWSKFYDREKLSKIVDYCILMAYDEHWAASPQSGSVASIKWVESGIEKSLKYIPKEKLILGMPFYTREWEETRESNGKITVKSKALSMEQVKARILENSSPVLWLSDKGQNYTEYTKDGKKYRIWIEDQKSIELKASLIYKYNLSGVSGWRKGFESKDTWITLNSIVKENKKVVLK